jgi:hypothetical protein
MPDAASPPAKALEDELRRVVKDICRSGDLSELTVKRVRAAAERNLGLREGFFKEPAWKARSKAFIEAEAVRSLGS